jgi:ArsR family transcriptional regulator
MLSECESQHRKSCCGPEELCSCKISERLGLSTSTISHHMSVLADAGLVTARKDGVWTYYTLQRDVLADAAETLKRY